MSENLVPTTSTNEISIDKKFINAATQHGNINNADEENIVVLLVSRSPNRETEDEVVWHENLEELIIQTDQDVSSKNHYYILLQMRQNIELPIIIAFISS